MVNLTLFEQINTNPGMKILNADLTVAASTFFGFYYLQTQYQRIDYKNDFLPIFFFILGWIFISLAVIHVS